MRDAQHKGNGAFAVGVVLSVVLMMVPICCGGSHYDATGRIGVLCIGDTSLGESPILLWLALDFTVQWQELPTDVQTISDAAAKRLVRIYTPRTLERLLQSYDLLLLLEPRMEWFSTTDMNRFLQGVHGGLSAMLTLWPDAEGYQSLVGSEFAAVFPQGFTPLFQPPRNLPFSVRLVGERPPVLTPFLEVGIEGFRGSNARFMYPRQGSVTWALARTGAGEGGEDEFIISWEYGDEAAQNWVIGVDVDEQWFNKEGGNDYGGDIVLNMIYFSTGKNLPPSIELIHSLRNDFFRYNMEKKLVLSVIEFVDRFGASTASLEREISETDQGRVQAEKFYFEGDYEGSYSRINEMIEQLATLSTEAIEVKERALLWVYLTEWSVVSGTLILAVFVLYSLMVRRRLFREVSVTRSG